MLKEQKKKEYEPTLVIINKYLAAATEIQSLIIKNRGKITWIEYIDIVKRHSISTSFLSNWTRAGFIEKEDRGIYKILCRNIEPIHIRQMLVYCYKHFPRNVKRDKKRLILKQKIAKYKNKVKAKISKFPYEDKWTDSFNMPAYNFVKPENHDKKQKSFSLFWGLINIKF